ncbi:MAG TPA: CBS domain-containing protein [Bdellovibrionales bacterium]|nr:CBS domain-containing protein [Bdellovibrionales bacterium]
MSKTASDFATGDVLYVLDTDPIKKAWEVMHGSGIRHVLVYDKHRRMVGIISDRDVKLAMQVTVDYSTEERNLEVTFDPEMLCSDFMSYPVETCKLTTPIHEIAKKMVEQKISAVVIFDQGHVHGLISHEDILREFLNTGSNAA